MLQKYYHKTSFGDPKVSDRDPKVGHEPPVENHCSKLPDAVFEMEVPSSKLIN